MTVTSSFAVGATETSVVVRIQGHATREHSPAFVSSVTALIEQTTSRRLMIDLQNCEYLDSTFLGSLVVLYRRANQQLSICAGAAQKEQLFASARIDRLISVLSPEKDCVPTTWQEICVTEEFSADDLVENVAVAHRCLADIEGPHADIYHDVADQLDRELRLRHPR